MILLCFSDVIRLHHSDLIKLHKNSDHDNKIYNSNNHNKIYKLITYYDMNLDKI